MTEAPPIEGGRVRIERIGGATLYFADCREVLL